MASSDPAVLPVSNVTVSSGCGTTEADLDCTLKLASGSKAGTSNVTVTASDAFGDTVKKTVVVTVAVPPTVGGAAPVSIEQPHTGQVTLTLTGMGPLMVTATSSNPTLLPSTGILVGLTGCTMAGRCVLTLIPAPDQAGVATVMVTVSDSYGQAGRGQFAVNVVEPPANGGGGGFSPLAFGILAGFWSLMGWIRRRRMGNPQG